MSEFAFLDPPVEVAATHPRFDMISARLRAVGLRPYGTCDDGHPSDPLIIDYPSWNREDLRRFDRLLEHCPDRPVIALGAEGPLETRADIILPSEQELLSVPGRLAAYRRRWLTENEAKLRISSAAHLGRIVRGECRPPDTLDILYIGDGSPLFLALQSELSRHGLEVTAALSALTAWDYLAARTFSLVVVDVSEHGQQGARFLEESAQRPGLCPAPIAARVEARTPLNSDAYNLLRSVEDVIDDRSNIESVARGISHIAHRHAAEAERTAATLTDPTVCDPITGLYTSAFFETHLGEQMRICDALETSLSVLTLRLQPAAAGNLKVSVLMPRFAKILQRLLRRTDCAARLDPLTIAISCRDVGYRGTVRLAERVQAALSEEASGEPGSPLSLGSGLTWRVAERRRYHSGPVDLIGAALEAPYRRPASHVA